MQTGSDSYGFSLDKAQLGQLADVGPHRIDSFSAQGDVPFGKGLRRGTDVDQAGVPTVSISGDFLGVSVMTHTQSQGFNPATTPSSVPRDYQDKDTVSVCREGRIWVNSTVAVAAGDLAYLITSGDNSGDFTNSAGGNVGPVGRFQSAGEGLVALDVLREVSAP
jgi:hypothetical protein